VTVNISDQEREDVTTYAQNALRLLAFGQIHTILDMEALKVGSTLMLTMDRHN
jgi:hypothetical protein